MGQGLSSPADHVFLRSVQHGELQSVEKAILADPSVVHQVTAGDRLSPLHVAAANGRVEILSMILAMGVHPDPLNRRKQTPLMLAAIHGQVSCVQRLIQANANILMFDSLNGRTCLHYAALYGHLDCLKAILSAASSSPVADSWGYARFVNVRDGKGATPLHLAARQRRADCVRELLDCGALASASTGNYICPGSTPLHLAARSGSLDCIRALLARGADRLQFDSTGRSPYTIALKQSHMACARLLDPMLSSKPLVWPSPLKLISELDRETKVLLERALMEENLEREKKLLDEAAILSASPSLSENKIDHNKSENEDVELCCICFEKPCAIEIRDCGHQICAACMLALCCHCKPDPATQLPRAPACPFCRCDILQLVVAEAKAVSGAASNPIGSKHSKSLCEGNKGFSSAMGPLEKLV